MKKRNLFGLAIIVILLLHLFVFPPVLVTEEWHDQLCLTRGCVRRVMTNSRGDSRQETEVALEQNCL